uniref:Phospho-N-acetylmuramoyl-pentapeptide-transferase n=1 Tax=uncultured Flavobacteriia bacterium TaxID=212695 RepID=H6RFW1_9BACT|nr:phospho-N-acetylmuramoyl-pentapeptide-transferas e [uncultured bacterium]CCF99922.1 phospho-N-acetylmuramoyl-pentapeptide-transferase [uncultured Flavobacteriia bacterium]
MLYYLFQYLNEIDFPGAGLFNYVSFRTALATLISLIIAWMFGGRIIRLLRKQQVGETIRDLGLEGQMAKQGTPTMGGLIILAAIIIPTLLVCKLDNIYVITMLIATIGFGTIGFIDDYIKVFKKNKEGLAGKFKVIGQVILGLIIACILSFHPDVVIKEKVETNGLIAADDLRIDENGNIYQWKEAKSSKTTIPFVKDNEFDYAWLLKWMGENYLNWVWIIFIPIVILIITAVSNGANMTDGLDGLAGGSSAIIGVTLAVLAYLSSNFIFADYLNIMYIPNAEELVIFMGAFIGACVGFLWYNSYPASVFMGDTGSLAIGGIIAVLAVAIRKELLIPVFCGIFLVENLSVMLQVGYFKYTKKRFGEGKRIFLMAPLHHHYQKLGVHESKIVSRFWIVGVMLAILSIVTLKIR